MAKRKKAAGSVPRDLAKGPIWEGGSRSLGIEVPQPDGTIARPYVALWVDAETGMVHPHELFDMEQSPDGGIRELVSALEGALSGEGSPLRGNAHGPATLRVRTEKEADAIRQAQATPSAHVEVVAELPMWEAVSSNLVSYVGGDAVEELEPFSWDVETPYLHYLYSAAAEFARREPWTFMADSPPIALDLGEFGPRKNARTVYACILGNGGEVFGLAVYYSFAGYDRTIESQLASGLSEEEIREAFETVARDDPRAADFPKEMVDALISTAAQEPPDEPPTEDSMAVYFDPADEHGPSYMEWLADRGLPVLSEDRVPMFFRAWRSGKVGTLSAREVESMALTLECVNAFVDRFRGELEPDSTAVLQSTSGQLQIASSYKGKPVHGWWPGDEYRVESGLTPSGLDTP